MSDQPQEQEEGPHPLERSWTWWYDKRQQGAPDAQWDSNLKDLGSFSTVEDFWRFYNHVEKPGKVPLGANYHLFKSEIKPMWEDDANKHGGKWVLNLQTDRALLDRYWENLVLALIGETLDDEDEVTGVVLSRRKLGDKIAIWNRHKDNEQVVMKLGRNLRECFQLPPTIKLEYYHHEDSINVGRTYSTPVRHTV
eukprot:c14229_g1_i1.p1 GENE.c14229_g1_i1~~c14229_g1_i1.p1  ORF type:complete len:205 (-),score=38.69 c14229_g1_i1:308-892(-)